MEGEVFAGEGELGATGHELPAGVGAQAEALVLHLGDQAQGGTLGHDDGAEGEVVGAIGGDDEAVAVGGEDGAAAAEGIGRGARRGGHDEAVAGIGGHEVVVDIEVGAEEGAPFEEAVDADFVDDKGVEGIGGLVGDYMKERAGLDGVAAGKEVGDQGGDVETACRGEEAQVTEVDADDGNLAAANQMDGAEEGAVAPDGEEEVVVAVGQGVGNFLGVDTVVVQDVAELLILVTVGFFDGADIESNLHKIGYYRMFLVVCIISMIIGVLRIFCKGSSD